MADLYLKRVGNGLMAADIESQKYLMKLHPGETIRGTFTKPRNVRFHRKYFALLNTIFDAGGCDHYQNLEAMRAAMIIHSGRFELVAIRKPDGKTITAIERHSISFAKMEELEFSRLYSETLDIGLKMIPKHWSREDLDNAVAAILEFDA